MKVFYVDSETHRKDDVLTAWLKAINIVKENQNIKTITFLVGQKSQYDLLSPLPFASKQIKNGGLVTADGYHIQFKTLKTYHPNYVFSNNKPSEIVISICISPKDLYQFEDKSAIACWIIVPWTLSENAEFLSIYEAEDCEHGTFFCPPSHIDDRVANAIDWLKQTSFPNEGYHHPNDEERLKNVAVTLKKMHMPVEYDSIVYYCLNNGFIPSAARKTADYIMRAQTHSMQIRDKYNLDGVFNKPRK